MVQRKIREPRTESPAIPPSSGYHSHSPRTKQTNLVVVSTAVRNSSSGESFAQVTLDHLPPKISGWKQTATSPWVGRTLGYDKLGFATELDADGNSSKKYSPKRWFDGDVSNRVYSVPNAKGIIQSIFCVVPFTQKHSRDGSFLNCFHQKQKCQGHIQQSFPNPTKQK